MTTKPRLDSKLPEVLTKSSIAIKPRQLEVFDGGTAMRTGLTIIESSALHSAQEGKHTRIIVGITDKGRQNPINYLGGKETAGDTALSAYWDMLRLALALCRKRVEDEYLDPESVRVYDVPMMRVSNKSDEGNVVFVISGRDQEAVIRVSSEIRAEFDRNLEMLKDYLTGASRPFMGEGKRYPILEDYEFRITADMGGGVLYIPVKAYSNLKKFGDILKYPEMVVSLTHRLSRPIPVRGDEEAGFLLNEIAKLEEEDIEFRHALPPGLRVRCSAASVNSPFADKLIDLPIEGEYIRDGFYLEVKLSVSDTDATQTMRFVSDNWDGKRALGTRKGLSELLGFDINTPTPEFGMRALNTFIGKAGANGILSAVANAVENVRARVGAAVIPVDSHLRYQIRTDVKKEDFAEALKAEIEKRMADIGGAFGAVIRTIDSQNVAISKVARAFELMAMGKTEYTPEILEKTNFLVNFIETVKSNNRNIQADVVMAIEFDTNGEQEEALENLEKLRGIFAARRTIRDTADVVAVLRNDKSIGITREERKQLEDWFFGFADTHYEQMKKNINALLS